jgi:hypothetical protein
MDSSIGGHVAINTQKVIVGGVAAGLAVGVADYVVNGILLVEQNDAALNALSPDLVANLAGGVFIGGIVVVALLMGIVVAWTYALLRPRYGAGPKTAVFAALQLWSVITLIFAAMTLTGLFTWSYFALGSVVSAGELLLASYVAGYLYSEE